MVGACGSFSQEVLKQALHAKKLYPARGAVSIRVDLEDDLAPGTRIPSPASLTRLFRGLEQTQRYEPNRPLPIKAVVARAAHDLWQIDDMGAERYAGLGYIGLLNVKDVYSRVHTGCKVERYKHNLSHCTTKAYVQMLRIAFRAHGLPKAIQSDRGSIFCENTTKSPFPTILHLWLQGLGVGLRHARRHTPTDQAVIERTHQTMHKQLQRTIEYASLEELQHMADSRRCKLNQRIPCTTLGCPPLVFQPNAKHSGRQFNPTQEEQLYQIENVCALLAPMEWFRKVSKVKTFALGKQIYYHPSLLTGIQIKIQFDPQSLSLNCYNDKELLAAVPIKGIAYKELTRNF